jgi:nitrogen fixation NifU-like protein
MPRGTTPLTRLLKSENVKKGMTRRLTKEELGLLKELGYSKKAVKLYVDKINVGVIDDPDVTETYVGPCGDVIKLYLKVDKNHMVKEAKFNYLGCPGSAISASAMINLVISKTIEEAKKLTEDDILKELRGLPKPKLDCPKLAIATLRNAIAEYEKRKLAKMHKGA